MTSTIVPCPACQRHLKVALAALGKKVRCPSCQAVFAANSAVAAPKKANPQETASNLVLSEQEATIEQAAGKNAQAPSAADIDISFLAPAQTDGELGRLGGYRVLKILGHGGMGVVFLGEDPKLGRKVAIKTMLPHLAARLKEQERFLREARSAAALEHDNIVPILHVGEDCRVPFIVMPFLRGESLETRLRAGPIPVPTILQIARQTVDALAFAHAQDFVHRDIKPANLWLESRPGRSLASDASSASTESDIRVKILDFGLARLAAHDEQNLTATGALLGTPGYLAPEQADGGAIDGRADVFSLGCVLYRLTTGKLAFPGDSLMTRLANLAKENPAPAHTVNAATPPALSELIERMLIKDRDTRPTAADVARALQTLPDHAAERHSSPTHAIQSGPPGGRDIGVTTIATSAPRSAEFPPAAGPDRPRSRKAFWVALAALFLIGGGILVPQVIIRIRNKDGTETRIEVPPGVEVIVEKAGKTVELPATYTNVLGMEFVKVPRGTGWLGGGGGKAGEAKVAFEHDFYLGKYEVTQDEWEKVTGLTPSAFSRTGANKDAVKDIKDDELRRCPVENVSWDDAQRFLERLNTRAQEKGWYYRLPTEAEWEYACRGGPMADRGDSAFDFYFGKPSNEMSAGQAAFREKGAGTRTSRVGSYVPNRLGLYNMHGNVGEWCDDEVSTGPGEAKKVARRPVKGGSWREDSSSCRAGARTSSPPAQPDAIGLRLARIPVPAMARKPVLKLPVPPEAQDERIDFAAQRIAAEKLLAAGGAWFVMRDAEGHPFGNSKDFQEKALPAGPFYLDNIHIDLAKATDATFAALSGCDRLSSGEIGFVERGGEGVSARLKSLPPCPRLRVLRLSQSDFGDDGMSWLERCPNLESLHILNTKVTDAGLVHLRHCPDLRMLDLPHGVGDDGLKAVVRYCPNLRFVNAGYGKNNIQSLQIVAGLPRLRSLWCRNEHLTEAAVAALAKMPFLQDLRIEHPGPDTLTPIAPLAGKLRQLHLVRIQSGRFPDSASWAKVAEFRELEMLLFDGTIGVDAAGLDRLAGLPYLRRLDFNHPPALVREFRQKRPDVELNIRDDKGGETFPRLELYPVAATGKSIAAWDLPKDAPPPATAPFSANDAKKHQKAWAAYMGKPVEETSKATGMKFRFIPPGEFDTALLPDGEARDSLDGLPLSRLRLTRPFWLGATEVTWAQFEKFVAATGYKTDTERGQIVARSVLGQADPKATWRTPGPYKPAPDEPVTQITHADACAFCAWLSKEDGVVYQLPSEAEWEFAARAGGTSKYGWVETEAEVKPHAWTQPWAPNVAAAGTSGLRPATQGEANPFGLHDVIGNVHEWCWMFDRVDVAVDPVGNRRGLRGLAYGYPSTGALHRRWNNGWFEAFASTNAGFRVLRQTTNDPPPQPATKVADAPVMVAKGQPLSAHTPVSRPTAIPGVRSWSIEPTMLRFDGCAWSPKGDCVATVQIDGMKVQLWDREGNLTAFLVGHSQPVSGISFSADGKLLATCDYGIDANYQGVGTLRVWDVATGATRVSYRLTGWAFTVAFAPVGRRVAVVGHIGAFIFDLDSGSVTTCGGRWNCRAVAWSPGGEHLVAGGQDGVVQVWDTRTGKQVRELPVPDWPNGKPVEISSVAWSPQGQWLAAGCHDAKVRLWDAKTGKHAKTIARPEARNGAPVHVVWHPDGRRLVTAWQGAGIVTIDAVEGKVLERLGDSFYSALSPDGTELFNFAGKRPQFIAVASGKVLREGPVCPVPVNFIARFGAFGLKVASEGWNQSFGFDPETGAKLPDAAWARADDGYHYRDTSRDGTREVYAGPVSLMVARKSSPPLTIKWPGNYLPARFDPSGGRVAAPGDSGVGMWDAATGANIGEFRHPGRVSGWAWSPDGERLATAGDDKTVRIWDVATGKLLARASVPKMAGENGRVRLIWESGARALWVTQMTEAVRIDARTGQVAPPQPVPGQDTIREWDLAPDGETFLVCGVSRRTCLRSPDGDWRALGQFLGESPQWLPDARRFVDVQGSEVRGFDTWRNQRLGTLFPSITGGHWLCISPDGHWRGSPGVEDHIVYVVMLEDGSQRTYTPAAFAKQFGSKNDPGKARLLGLGR